MLASVDPSRYIKTVIDPNDFRHVLGHFATGVTIISTRDARGPADRPHRQRVLVRLARPAADPRSASTTSRRAIPALRDRAGSPCNVLGHDQEHVSRRFATTRLDKVRSRSRTGSASLGLPLVEGALAQLECTTVSAHVAGDHTIFVGRVEAARVFGEHPPLYFRASISDWRDLLPGA